MSHVAGAMPRTPEIFRDDKPAKKKYRSTVCQLLERRAVTEGDVDMITIYVSTWQRWMQALENLRTEGLIVETTRLDSNGIAHAVLRPNLSLKIAEVCERSCLSYLAKLGLTPKDRELVKPTNKVNTGKEKSAVEKLHEDMVAMQAKIAAEKERDQVHAASDDEDQALLDAIDTGGTIQ